jgi:hypothetical protein
MNLPIRRIAGALTILEGIWLLYHQPIAVDLVVVGGLYGVLTFVLVLDGVLGLAGVSHLYSTGAVLSMVFLVLMGLAAFWEYPNYPDVAASDALAALLAVAAIWANLRSRPGKLSEQANPMNLPVFG